MRTTGAGPGGTQQTPTTKWSRVKVILLSAAALSAFALTITERHFIDALVSRGRDQVSSMMRLEQIDWEEVGVSNLSPRVTRELLLAASGLKIGQEILPIDLGELEEKLSAIPWIESLQIQKKLPSTLSVRYTVHNARAIGLRHAKPWLVSDSGKWIAPFDRANSALDLPILGQEDEFEPELAWLDALENTLGNQLAQVHEVNFAGAKMTTLVDIQYASQAVRMSIIGPERLDPESLNRLNRVVRYLIKNNILVSNIDLRLNKKVVVNVGKRP